MRNVNMMDQTELNDEACNEWWMFCFVSKLQCAGILWAISRSFSNVSIKIRPNFFSICFSNSQHVSYFIHRITSRFSSRSFLHYNYFILYFKISHNERGASNLSSIEPKSHDREAQMETFSRLNPWQLNGNLMKFRSRWNKNLLCAFLFSLNKTFDIK